MSDNDWQPTTSRINLALRATLLSNIRAFFAKRAVLEVETPLLSQHSVTDLHIDSFQTKQGYYLQTSPEYAMKRLLAAGSGPIFQITKAFRKGEAGHRHNPEFTMLEWYRPGFTHHTLMDEMDRFLQTIAGTQKADRMTYQAVWLKTFNVDPHTCDAATLQTLAEKQNLQLTSPINDKDTLLQLLLSHCIEPGLGLEAPLFLYDFPASQAALAKISAGSPPVAERFELYIKGAELANGFHELTDAKEQHERFQKELAQRKKADKARLEIDQRLIAALQHGLPACAGVALGLDRLLMLMANAHNIQAVINFPWERA